MVMRPVHVPAPAHPRRGTQGLPANRLANQRLANLSQDHAVSASAVCERNQACIGHQLDRHSSVRTGLRTVAAYLLARGYLAGYRRLDTGDGDALLSSRVGVFPSVETVFPSFLLHSGEPWC